MSALNDKFSTVVKNGETKFIVVSDEYGLKKGQIITLHNDDTSSMPEFIINGKVEYVSISTLELYITEENNNSGTIENDITGAVDILVNDQVLIKLCDNESGKYIQYIDQVILISNDTYRKVMDNLVDNREFNTSPFDYNEDYFLSKLGFNVPKYK